MWWVQPSLRECKPAAVFCKYRNDTKCVNTYILLGFLRWQKEEATPP